ncbi:MAG: sodium-translocating pyrophosphatase [Candidatus Aenigmatarchaeota archaeon]|nr:MAG: sodium-translocating pyrophosphatase [Candidatus Aenigmarchaeota archaeon]
MAMIEIGVSLLALLVAGIFAWSILRMSPGNAKMVEISRAIQEGSFAYLKRQYTVVSIFAVVLAAALWLALGPTIAIGFVFGAFLSALAGFVGMNISVRANARTAHAAQNGLNAALGVAFRGGAVTGLSVVGLGLFGVSVMYMWTGSPLAMVGFGFGASLISLFARVGGGIYTKAADVGADLVGKVEAGIPEDDPRNPAVIADNVGDNVGDCAGMAADLFETYAVTILAAMILGVSKGGAYVTYPLMLGAAAIVASIIGTFFVRASGKKIMRALYMGLLVSAVLSAAAFYYITMTYFANASLFYASLAGLGVAVALNFITDYYTSKNYRPVISIAEASETGPATNLINGLGIGMKATAAPLLVIVAGILLSYHFGGVYGIAIAGVAMLSLTGIIVAIDSYGPITDNAGGIAEMAGLPKRVREITDALDAVGNTTKAVTKGYAIGSAALATLALFVAYVEEVSKAGGSVTLALTDPLVVAGLFIGAMIPFLFSSYLMNAVGVAAKEVVKEVRRQFRTMPIMKGKAKPDYARCVSIVTASAQRELVIPGLIAVASPILVGFVLGPVALGGMLIGCIMSGLLLAIQMTTGGAAWDNAKKYIEGGKFGGKGSNAHKAAVVGDTVGDPLKDTAGPAINPLIKVMNIVALLLASSFVMYSLL